MSSDPFKVFLSAVGLTLLAIIGAYLSGALDRFIDAPPAQIASLPTNPPAPAAPQGEAKSDRVGQPETPKPDLPKTADETGKPKIVPPSFDIVRAEPDGSLVIAGKAPAGSIVEIITGSKTLGQTKATPEGEFAVVLDNPLAPGDYQIVLRATDENNLVAMSPETAVVSIPDKKDGQVLALVEQPGQPSKLITVPEPKPAEPPQATTVPTAPEPAKPEQPQVAVAKPEPAPAKPSAKADTIAVKAIEIEGNKVFVAGIATPDKLVRVYANELMLGETKASPSGEFLVETIRELAVGDYIVRADLIAPNGTDVLARAQVPFSRVPGETIAAVAADKPAPQPAPEPVKQQADAPATPPQQVAGGVDTGDPKGNKQAEPIVNVPAPDMALSKTPPVVTAEPLQPVNSAVIIRRGDTLWQISRRVYGRGVRYSTIYLANQQQISDPNRIWPGQVFSVPDKTDEGENADMNAIGDQKTTMDPAKPGTAAEAANQSVVR